MNDDVATGRVSRVVCEWSDLPPDQCGHCAGLPSVVSIGVVEQVAQRRMPEVRVRPREWHVPEPQAVKCDHRVDDLCGDCSKILDGLLADLPAVVAELVTAMRKGYRFTPHGWRKGDVETPDEAPIGWNPAAAGVLHDVRFFMADPPTDRHLQLFELSRLIRRAHRVIDRPADREVTMCPECRGEIVVTNRSLAVTCGATIVENDPDAKPVDGEPAPQRRRICTYAADWKQHRRDLLAVNQDAQLTMDDLLAVLSDAGENINRDKINNLVRRHGLPREEIRTAVWVDGRIDPRTKWVYRLGDVLFLLAQIEERKAG